MQDKIKKSNKGFTIIEVLIVLAIAGLIMLIVFLAVPALQRNSRNTQRRSEVSNTLGAVNEYLANNGGTLPTTATDFTGSVKYQYYTPPTATNAGNIAWASTFSAAPTADVDKMYVYGKATCTSATTIAAGTSNRQVAALYWIETGSATPSPQCVQG